MAGDTVNYAVRLEIHECSLRDGRTIREASQSRGSAPGAPTSAHVPLRRRASTMPSLAPGQRRATAQRLSQFVALPRHAASRVEWPRRLRMAVRCAILPCSIPRGVPVASGLGPPVVSRLPAVLSRRLLRALRRTGWRPVAAQKYFKSVHGPSGKGNAPRAKSLISTQPA